MINLLIWKKKKNFFLKKKRREISLICKHDFASVSTRMRTVFAVAFSLSFLVTNVNILLNESALEENGKERSTYEEERKRRRKKNTFVC